MKLIGIKNEIAKCVEDIDYKIHRFRSRCRGYYERIKEIVLFIPILWRSYTWDYSSIYLILAHWIERMAKGLSESNIKHVGYENDVKRMRIVRHCLMRLYNDDYRWIFDDHDKRWGQLEFINGTIQRPGVYNEETKEQQWREYKLLAQKEDLLKKQDINMAFNLIKKYHGRWWS